MPRPTTNLKPTKIIYKPLDASPLIDKQFVSIAVKKKELSFWQNVVSTTATVGFLRSQ